MAKTNPNGANQYLLDPRQKLCWKLYTDPNSETFGNGLQSALKAGYDETTALGITCANWFREKARKLDLLDKAEKVLEETLEMETVNNVFVGDEVITRVDSSLVKIKQDTAKFVAERLGKRDYSTRSELTGEDGEELIKQPYDEEQIKNIARRALGISTEAKSEGSN